MRQRLLEFLPKPLWVGCGSATAYGATFASVVRSQWDLVALTVVLLGTVATCWNVGLGMKRHTQDSDVGLELGLILVVTISGWSLGGIVVAVLSLNVSLATSIVMLAASLVYAMLLGPNAEWDAPLEGEPPNPPARIGRVRWCAAALVIALAAGLIVLL